MGGGLRTMAAAAFWAALKGVVLSKRAKTLALIWMESSAVDMVGWARLGGHWRDATDACLQNPTKAGVLASLPIVVLHGCCKLARNKARLQSPTRPWSQFGTSSVHQFHGAYHTWADPDRGRRERGADRHRHLDFASPHRVIGAWWLAPFSGGHSLLDISTTLALVRRSNWRLFARHRIQESLDLFYGSAGHLDVLRVELLLRVLIELVIDGGNFMKSTFPQFGDLNRFRRPVAWVVDQSGEPVLRHSMNKIVNVLARGSMESPSRMRVKGAKE